MRDTQGRSAASSGVYKRQGDLIDGVAVIENPGPRWGIGIVHDTGVNLDSTGGNHYLYWVGVYPEVQ